MTGNRGAIVMGCRFRVFALFFILFLLRGCEDAVDAKKSRSRVSKAGGLNANEDIDSSSKKSKKKRRDPERTENAMDNGASKNQPGGTDRPDRKIKDQSIANRASRPRKQVMEPSKRKVEDDAEENKPTRKRKSNRSRKPKKSKGESARTESSSDPAILELQAMSKLHEKLLSSQRTGSTPAELLRVHQHLPLPSKNDRIDDILALGYALFLSQRYQDAHRVFDELYRALPTTAASAAPGVFLGLVQALSSLNRMDEATKFADKLLQAKPDFREGYNIKMQLLSLKNRHDEATSFLTSELKNPKVDKLFLIMLRGKAYYKMKKFASAHTDFSTVNRTAPWSMRAEVLGWLGRTERELGNNDVAASYLKRSIAQDPTQAETMYELALSYMEVADVEESMKYMNATLELDPRMKIAWSYAGLFLQTMGECRKALHYFSKALEIDSTEHTSLMLTALCHMTELNFEKMLDYFQKMLDLKETVFQILWPNAFFRREVAYFWLAHFDTPFSQFSIDVGLDPLVKLGLHTNEVKNKIDEVISSKNNQENRRLAMEVIKKQSDRKSLQPPKAALEALKLMSFTKPWIQLGSPGFLPHTRQHRQFGLAVLEMAQALRAHVRAIQRGESGILVSNAGSAFTSSPLHQADASEHVVDATSGGLSESVSGEGKHVFSYRDFLEIAVKWRQLAEPFDIVFWLDLYTAIPDMDVVTLTTSLYSGLKKNARYYQYFNFTFETAKHYMKQTYYLNDHAIPVTRTTSKRQVEDIERAATLEQLFEISGALRSFYIITDTFSLVSPGTILPGTKIIISKIPPEGFDISIGAPSNEKRFVLYSAEVKRTFDRIVHALSTGADSSYIVDLTLEFYFYWAQWGPLSRGTAATGYATILAVLLAHGEVLTSRVPRLKQMDWEAILRSDPAAFCEAVRPWLSGRAAANGWVSAEWLDGAAGHRLADIFRTPRDVMTTLASG